MLKPYDIFISYVVEDREIVEELYHKLVEKGFKVWYANRELRPGVKIRDLVNEGLRKSRYGIAIISRQYNGHWSQGELFVLIGKEKNTFIPILHDITIEEAAEKHPGLINIYCLDTHRGSDKLTEEILKVVKPMPCVYYPIARFQGFVNRHIVKSVATVLVLISSSVLFLAYSPSGPPKAMIESVIRERAVKIFEIVNNELKQDYLLENGASMKLSQISQLEDAMYFEHPDAGEKDKYSFNNGFKTLSTMPSLISKGIFQSQEQVRDSFGFVHFNSYIFNHSKAARNRLKYAIWNAGRLDYKVTHIISRDGKYEVEVEYTNALRYAEVCILIDLADNKIFRHTSFLGLKPHETIVFEKKGDSWTILGID